MNVTQITFICLLWSTYLQAQPRISFENDAIDFKHISKGSDCSGVFVFKNTGEEDLKIEDISSTSDLLEVTSSYKTIKPGEKGKIKVSYNTEDSGPIRRTITIKSNAQNTAVKTLKLKGYIEE